MENPDPNAPPAAAGEELLRQTPLQWFAEAYPFNEGPLKRKAHEDELILLQKRINGEAKNLVRNMLIITRGFVNMLW